MSEEHPYIIDTVDEVSPNRFPGVAQVSVLGLILLVIFSSLLWQRDEVVDVAVSSEVSEQLEIHNQEVYPLVTEFSVTEISEINLRARAAFIWDVKSGSKLYEKNATEVLPLASITKLMTALLTHELLPEEELAVVPASAIRQEGSSGLLVGEKFDVKSLRNLALIASSNDAAYALGANVGELLGAGDPASQFVQGMNIRAAELGLTSLAFWNTTGLDLSPAKPGAVGSAKDVSLLMSYIIKTYPDIISATQVESVRIYNNEGEYHEAVNTNDLVLTIPGLLGSKTGYTDLAGGNLTVAFNVGFDRPIVVTVLGSTREERFTDVMLLVDAVKESVVK